MRRVNGSDLGGHVVGPERARDQDPGLQVVLLENRVAVGEALRLVLEHQGVATVTTASTSQEARHLACRNGVTAIVINLENDLFDPIVVGETLLREKPDLGLIAVSGTDDAGLVGEVKDAGFRGFVHKDASLAQFADVVIQVSNGGTVLPRDVRVEVPREDVSESHAHALLLGRQLTLREHEVLAMLVQGASSAEIARDMRISSNTVRTHIQNVMMKLQVHSRLQAVMFAVRHGLVAGPTDIAGSGPNRDRSGFPTSDDA